MNRLGKGFLHVIVSDMTPPEKDYFIDRWCDLVELPGRAKGAAVELKKSLSLERIQKLTNTPLLLTTLALVKRKIGKLPNRRADLYLEAVNVLLNWRSEVDDPLDPREALPQLEYLAYHMTEQKMIQVEEDMIIKLWQKMRKEFESIRILNNHTPEELLKLVESRTGLIVQMGTVRRAGRPMPVFEFRHLTFQEYLCALALAAGRWPGPEKGDSLPERVAVLASEVKLVDKTTGEYAVVENLREPLRLCVACCDDRVVDDVLISILSPIDKSEWRARASPAASCLADDPNVLDETADTVITTFANSLGEEPSEGIEESFAKITAEQLGESYWMDSMANQLVRKFLQAPSDQRAIYGRFLSVVMAPSVGKLYHSSEWDEVLRSLRA